MAAKRKQRYSPDPNLGTPSTGGSNVQVPTARGAGAARPPSSQPLAQLSGQLSRFNKALVGYQMGKIEKATEEAQQYTEGMSSEISAKSYGFKRFLKKMGFSQWRNPWVYSKQIVNVASNQANKDFASLLVDKEFRNEWRAIKENAGNDYEKKASQLFDKARATKFKREAEFKKEGAYWDIGYGDAWQKAKDAAVVGGMDAAAEYKELNVRRAFFEGGRDQLWQSVKEGNKTKFRKFISEGFSTVPLGDNVQTGVAIFKNIIQPVFEEMVEKGDDLDEIARMYKEVTGMSRDVLDKDGKRTGGVHLFKDKHGDIDPSDQGYLSIQQFWRQLEDKYEKSEDHSRTKVRQTQDALTNKAKADLRSLEDTKKQHSKVFEAHDLMDLQFPFDANDTTLMRKVASAFAEIYGDDVEELGGAKEEDNRLFFELFTAIVETANKDIVTGSDNSVAANLAFKEQNAALVGRFIQSNNLAPDIMETVNTAITKGKAGAGRRYPKEWLEDMGAAGIQDLFYNANPNIVRGSVAWAAAVERHMRPIVSGAIVDTAFHQLAVIKDKYRNRTTDEDDLHTLWALKADLLGDKTAGDLREEVDKLAGRVALLNDNSAQFKEVGTDTFKADIHYQVLAELRTGNQGPDFEKIEAYNNLDVEYADPDTESTMHDPILRNAAKSAMAWFKGPFTDKMSDEAMSTALDQMDTSVDKKTWWAATGVDIYKADLTKRLIAGGDELNRRYQDNSNAAKARAKSGAAERQREGTNLTPEDTSRAAKLDQVVGKLQEFWDTKRMSSSQAITDTTSSDLFDSETREHHLLENFFAGPEGNKFWRNIKKTNDAAKESFQKKLSDHAIKVQSLKELEAGNGKWFSGSKESQVAEARKELHESTVALKDHAKHFQAHSWEEIVDDNFTMTIDNEFGEPIKVKLSDGELNFNEVLLFQSLGGIEEMTEEWNTLTGHLTKEDTDVKLDPSKASEKLQKLAALIRQSHGVDILHPEYKQRSIAEDVVEGLWARQSNMLMARFPERIPTEIFQTLEHNALEDYINSDRTTWQNKDVNSSDKEWVSGVFRQRRDILSGMYNIDDGITWDQFKKLYKQSVGGTMPLTNSKYQTRRLRWSEFQDKNMNKGTHEFIRIEIADEIARGSLGVSNPHNRSKDAYRLDAQQSQSGKTGEEWNWGLHQAKKKFEGIIARAHLADDSPSPELAEAFNTLVISLGSQRFLRPASDKVVPNKFGISPMLIPQSRRPLPPRQRQVIGSPEPPKEEKAFGVDQYLKPKDK
jgi:hypothetical protein